MVEYVELEDLHLDTFARQLNTMFRVLDAPAGAAELLLIEATDSGGCCPEKMGGQEHFSLLFRGPDANPLAQHTYRFEHEQVGSFDLFIVPIGWDGEWRHYQAVFNRLKNA